jgi:hypothetical protein
MVADRPIGSGTVALQGRSELTDRVLAKIGSVIIVANMGIMLGSVLNVRALQARSCLGGTLRNHSHQANLTPMQRWCIRTLVY